MTADLIIEWIQRNLVLVTFRVMLLVDAVTVATVVTILMKMVMMMVVMGVNVMVQVLVLSLETRRTALFCSQMGRATGLDDTGKVMTVGELLLMVILQVRREFVGAAFR